MSEVRDGLGHTGVGSAGMLSSPRGMAKSGNRDWTNRFLGLGWYAQRRRTFRLERNTDFSRCAMFLNAQIPGILAAM